MDGNPDKHYITIFMKAQVASDSLALENKEPHKCLKWEWVQWSDIVRMPPEQLFDPMVTFIKDVMVRTRGSSDCIPHFFGFSDS